MKIILALFLSLLITSIGGLDFDRAIREKRFKSLPNTDHAYRLDPSGLFGLTSMGLFRNSESKVLRNSSTILDLKESSHSDSLKYNFYVNQTLQTNYYPGLTLTILKFSRSRHGKGKVKINFLYDNEEIDGGTVDWSEGVPNNEGSINKGLIFTTDENMDNSHSHVKSRGIQMELENIDDIEEIYFVVTAFSAVKKGTSCSVIGMPGISWWKCKDDNNESSEARCISYDLTCNSLPNCGQRSLPNTDEDCIFVDELQVAMKILLYTITVLVTLIIVFSIVKCAILRCSSGSQTSLSARLLQDLVEQEQRDLQSVAQPERPVNSPPTYDDAMKAVNQAFQHSEDETDLPPDYSESQESVENSQPGSSNQQNECNCSLPGPSGRNSNSYSNNNNNNNNTSMSEDLNSCPALSATPQNQLLSAPAQSRWPIRMRQNSNNQSVTRNGSQLNDDVILNREGVVNDSHVMPTDPPPYSP